MAIFQPLLLIELMARDNAAPGARLLRLWARLAPFPGGRRVFGFLLGRMVPYTASIRPLFLTLEPGHARVALRDRRALRNHLGSIHAVALANLGELATGLALLTALEPGVRGIPTRLTIQYLKKARGFLLAECRAPATVVGEAQEQEVEARITDSGGEPVATVTARWRLSPP